MSGLTQHAVPAGTELKVTLHVDEQTLTLKGQVKHAEPNVGLGIEFHEIRKGERQILQFLIRKLAEKHLEDNLQLRGRPIGYVERHPRAARLPMLGDPESAKHSLARRPPLRPLLHATSRLLAVDFFQARSFAFEAAQIVELGAADFRGAQQLHLVDHLGIEREDTLHAVAEADLAHGEAGLRPPAARDHHAFERLQAFLVAFLDLDVHPDGIARHEFGMSVRLVFASSFSMIRLVMIFPP